MDMNFVWERTGKGTMSANRYAFMVALWTALGIATSAVAAFFSLTWEGTLLLLIPAIGISIIGVLIALNNDNPVVSLLGYMLVTVTFGLVTGPLVAMYTTASVARILFLTTTVVVGLGVFGVVYPRSLESWGSWLFGGLLILLAGLVILPIAAYLGIPVGAVMTLWDWAGVAVFSFYVIYDMNQAMRIPYTMDNAIDSAVAVYLDFANLFIRLLMQLGEVDDD